MVFTGKESSYPFVIEDLLRHTAEVGGSDLHLVAGIEPCVRINGDLKRQISRSLHRKILRKCFSI